MDFVNVKYTGTRGYIDRTPLRNTWQPGETKMVPAGDARALTRFAEFSYVETKAGKKTKEQQQAEAEAKQQVVQQQEQDEHDMQESILLTVQAMDKAGLKAYAEKYDVKLDARKKEAELRLEVTNLVEQFGAR